MPLQRKHTEANVINYPLHFLPAHWPTAKVGRSHGKIKGKVIGSTGETSSSKHRPRGQRKAIASSQHGQNHIDIPMRTQTNTHAPLNTAHKHGVPPCCVSHLN